MKRLTLCLLAAALLVLAPAAFANSISVTNAAAMGGSTFGMELDHNNSSAAYVQDNTPAGETIYRAEFLYGIPSFNMSGNNVRQTVFRGVGDSPNPGQFACTAAAQVTVFDIYIYWIFGGVRPFMTAWLAGDGCGFAAVGTLIDISDMGADADADNEVRVCWEMTVGADAGTLGTGKLAVVDDGDLCSSGSFQMINRDNDNTNINLVRLGTPQTNGFPAGQTATMYFDDFSSFRSAAF